MGLGVAQMLIGCQKRSQGEFSGSTGLSNSVFGGILSIDFVV